MHLQVNFGLDKSWLWTNLQVNFGLDKLGYATNEYHYFLIQKSFALPLPNALKITKTVVPIFLSNLFFQENTFRTNNLK